MENSDKLLNAAKKLWDRNIQNKSDRSNTANWTEQIEHYKKLLSIFHAGDYYYLLFDLVNGGVASSSEELQQVLGYDPKSFDSKLLFEIIHPEDRFFVINFEEIITGFLNALSYEEYPFYKFQYDVRLKASNGNYKRILVQYLMVDYDKDNIFHSFHIHTDISHIKPKGEPSVSIIGIDGRPSYYNIKDFVLKKSFDIFTKRERDILKGIVEGKTSQQIADDLSIKLYTVNTHRRNILEKADVKSPLELVQKTLKEAWI
ncbi:LuxR C-terminal-related transcriptional regulator [Soonwooa sp.]|uniref:LuxR C-terminal-related transcriptional regulator n=1 Tax=Soonwooa sp. TaxID=1938592 RepID=UPI00262AB644|nr:LuxR C-terminal-related transcriptional regulator [Soonwooa sp.]